MGVWLRTRWEGIATSLWFFPLILVAAEVAAAILALNADIAIKDQRPWWLYSGSAEGAVTLLATLLGALITMATLAVSITMVVLTLAANQLGPRLIRSFMADKRTQLALGLFLGTIVYLVLTLRTLHRGLTEEQTPHIAISTGTLLTIACVIVLLFFVHHLARSIVSDNVVERVGAVLDKAAEALLPERGAEARAPRPPALEAGARHSLPCSSYVQAVDYDALAEAARRNDATVELAFRPGHYILAGLDHMRVAPPAALTGAMKREIAACIALGPERTPGQDIEYSVRQLVEIALRALSPGINDPYTALAVIDRLSAVLVRVMDRGEPSGAWCDRDGTARVFGPVSNFDGIVDAAFNQIRQTGAGNAAILIRLAERLEQLQDRAITEQQRAALARHAEVVTEVARRSLPEQSDLDACLRRRDAAVGAPAGPAKA